VTTRLPMTPRVNRVVIEAQFMTALLGDAALGDEDSSDLE
jgi:hypothetical protein